MPSNYNPNEINALVLHMHQYGCDSINLFQDADKNEVCRLVWSDITVNGLALPGQIGAAIQRAEQLLRSAIIAAHPSVTLPEPLPA